MSMSFQFKPLQQQVIVITGASSGIGLATAEKAAAAGAKLVLMARSEQTLAQIATRLQAAGTEVLVVPADVADRVSLQAAADGAVTRFGRVDTWINNAGLSIYGRLDQVSEADSRRLFDVNFWGVVNGSLVALPLLRHGGALINLGSEVSDAVVPLQGMYSASKHAVKGFTDALRVELEELDQAPISITLIQPTAVDTPFPEHARNYLSSEPQLPTPRITPDEVADAILKAATEGGRDVRVGAMAVLNTLTAKVAPPVADKMAAAQARRQLTDTPPRDPEGTLFKPGETGRTQGAGPGHGHPGAAPAAADTNGFSDTGKFNGKEA